MGSSEPPHGGRAALRRVISVVFLVATAAAVGFALRDQDWSSVRAIALPVLLGPVALSLTAVLLGIGIALDGGTYAYAFQHHGIAFGLPFAALHLLVTLTSAVAASIGILQALLMPGMTRRLYGAEEPA